MVPFSRSQSGPLKLLVHKDRRGYLHRAHEIAVNVDPGHGALTLAFTQVDHATGTASDRAEPSLMLATALRRSTQRAAWRS